MSQLVRVFKNSRAAVAASAAVLVLVFSSAATAAEHRAKLSSDLTQKIKAGSQENTSVFLFGGEAEIEAIAARHGARVKKRLQHSSVLDVTPEQLLALVADPAVPRISGDAKVQRMMAVTTQATGADQVHNGVAGLPGYTGR